jgi:hypothetical protein
LRWSDICDPRYGIVALSSSVLVSSYHVLLFSPLYMFAVGLIFGQLFCSPGSAFFGPCKLACDLPPSDSYHFVSDFSHRQRFHMQDHRMHGPAPLVLALCVWVLPLSISPAFSIELALLLSFPCSVRSSRACFVHVSLPHVLTFFALQLEPGSGKAPLKGYTVTGESAYAHTCYSRDFCFFPSDLSLLLVIASCLIFAVSRCVCFAFANHLFTPAVPFYS